MSRPYRRRAEQHDYERALRDYRRVTGTDVLVQGVSTLCDRHFPTY
jgi:hypothetical protein